MSFSAKENDTLSSGITNRFVTEDDIEEFQRKRQEEWEKIRKPDDPIERPETIIQDSRSLYERLQEQKDKKQEEWEEQHKFKNLFRGIDGEEADFLDQVSQQQMAENARRYKADTKELNEYKNAVLELQETPADVKKDLIPKKPTIQAKTTSQAKLLAGSIVLKRKSSDSSANTETKKQRTQSTEIKPTETSNNDRSEKTESELTPDSSLDNSASSNNKSSECSGENCAYIWGGLPQYSDSSDSDSSSSDSDIISTKIIT